jgi:hypothetical protein
MAEKDKFGEKLRDKEKGDEDRYFAQRDRELLAKIKTRFADDTSTGEQTHMRCPTCGESLSADTVDRIRIDICPACQGLWLSGDKLEQAAQQEERGWLTRCLDRIKGRSRGGP